MANYELLKQGLVAVIKENGNQEITGQLLQQQLLAIINSLGAGYLLIGAATETTNPGTPDQNVAYLAVGPGTYTNFGGLVVTDPLVLLKWNGQWSQETLSTGIKALFAAVISDIDDINDAIVAINATILSLQNNKADKNGWYNGLVAGAAENLIGQMPASAFFTYRQTDDGKAGTGAAQIQTIKGLTLKWNQQIPTISSSWTAAYGRPITLGANSMKCEWIGSTMYANDLYVVVPITYKILAAHKYYIVADMVIEGNTNSVLFSVAYGGEINADGRIISSARATSGRVANIAQPQVDNTLTRLYFNFANASAANISSGTKVTFSNVQIFDITDIFSGVGYEPATVDEFTALFLESYYANNAGTLLPFKGTAIKTIGFNQWDEQWEEGGLSTANGSETTIAGYYRSKNYTPVLSGVTYYFKTPIAMTVLYYDSNRNYLSSTSANNATITVPANATYLRFRNAVANTWTPYANNICVNISDPTKNGQYEPHQVNTLNINAIGKTAKDGNGNAIIPFPTSVYSARNAFDQYGKEGGVVRLGIIDMGSLTWTKSTTRFQASVPGIKMASSDSSAANIITAKYNTRSLYLIYGKSADGIAVDNTTSSIFINDSTQSETTETAFKAAMSGVYLVFELATPVPFTWDEPLPLNYPVNRLGTEMLEPTGVDGNGVPQTAPLTAEIIYPIDAIGTLLGLPQDYISQGSDINLLEAMKSAGLITAYTRTFNATTGKYEYTFTV